jgi:hypothetical protein
VAASILRRHGWPDVRELAGGYEGWSAFERAAQAAAV